MSETYRLRLPASLKTQQASVDMRMEDALGLLIYFLLPALGLHFGLVGVFNLNDCPTQPQLPIYLVGKSLQVHIAKVPIRT